MNTIYRLLQNSYRVNPAWGNQPAGDAPNRDLGSGANVYKGKEPEPKEGPMERTAINDFYSQKPSALYIDIII
ncbi:hypothetical protein KY358_02220 [Candidatus Woesearchaeota archaeon]|nr:hypothetical protein [Candidatus Woesearchaeota archaeon]